MISKVQITRRVTQILSFLFFAGLYTLAFSGILKLIELLFQNSFAIDKISIFLFPMLLVLLTTLIFGRFFCGWLCAFGAFNDFLYHLLPKRLHKKFRIHPKADRVLKYLKHCILLLLLLMTAFNLAIPVGKLSPWVAFGQLKEFTFQPGTLPFAYLLLGLIIVGALFIERFFCRYCCPLGSILALISKLSFFKISKPVENCKSCKLCSISCPMGIELSGKALVKETDCISCLRCVTICPRQNSRIRFLMGKIDLSLYVASSMIVSFLFILLNLSGVYRQEPSAVSVQNKSQMVNAHQSVTKEPGVNNQPTLSVKPANKYRDGIYTATSNGFHPELKVEVSIKADRIADIKILSHHETPGFYETPVQLVPAEIIQKQSTDVDTVSGATYTSIGIIDAVKDVLQQASIEGVNS